MPTHEQNRQKVCLICIGKGHRKIPEQLKDLIQTHIFDDFIPHQNKLPCSICTTCRVNISSYRNVDTSKWLPLPQKYDYVQLLKDLERTTSDDVHCCCKLCEVATSSRIDHGNRSLKSGNKKPVGRPALNPKKAKKFKPVSVRLCTRCHGEVRRGISHKCNESEKYKNIQQRLSPKSKERVASTFLREQSNSATSKDISVKNRTRHMNVTVGGIKKIGNNNNQTSHQTLLGIQAKRNMSNNTMMHVAHDLRQGGGDIEPRFERELVNRGKMLSEFFEAKTIKWQVKEKDSDVVINITKQAIICKDVKGLVDYVVRKREVKDVLYRVGIDGGREFIKICLNIIDPSCYDTQRRNKKSYSFNKKHTDSGVKKLLILAVVEDKTEMYENLREMITLLDLNNSLDYFLAADLKVINVVLGIQNHSATYPCAWC